MSIYFTPYWILLVPVLQNFLDDYGLIWVGDGETSDSAECEQTHSLGRGLWQPGIFIITGPKLSCKSRDISLLLLPKMIPKLLYIFPLQAPLGSGISTWTLTLCCRGSRSWMSWQGRVSLLCSLQPGGHSWPRRILFSSGSTATASSCSMALSARIRSTAPRLAN